MIKRLIIGLMLCLQFMIGTPMQAMQGVPNYYVAVFTSKDLAWLWEDKYTPDYRHIPASWKEFPQFLENAKILAKGRPILLELDFHGSNDPKYFSILSKVDERGFPRYQHASMGYIVKNIVVHLKGQKFLVLLESCYAGTAYTTIRGNNHIEGKDFMDNYPYTPYFPIYGTGDNFVNYDISMFMQFKHNIRLWFEDLRKYEKTPPRPAEPPAAGYEELPFISNTVLQIKKVTEFIREFLP